MAHNTIFIADLHLSNTTYNITESFIKFLTNITNETDAIYILGDLFQFWVGDDDRAEFNLQIQAALKKASCKAPIYLMPGNRDFLLDKSFANNSGCTLLNDPYTINLYGKKTLLTHGDLLVAEDIKYRIFRTMVRIPYAIKIFLKLPLKWRIWLASNIQKYSAITKAYAIKNNKSLKVSISSVKTLLKKFNAEQLIYGHLHIAESQEFILDTQKVRRLSLGQWEDNNTNNNSNRNPNNILIYYSDHSFTGLS